jgi:AraC family transcriptional regulator
MRDEPYGCRSGRILMEQTLADVRVTHAAYDPRCRLVRHWHRRDAVAIVVHGGFEESEGGRTSRYEEGQMLFRSAGLVHANELGPEGCHTLNIERLRVGDTLWPHLSAGLDGSWRLVRVRMVLARRLIFEMQTDGCRTLTVESLLAELLAELSREPLGATADRTASWLPRAEEMLRTRCPEAMALGEMARECGVHPSHFARAFRARYGRTAGEYARELRLSCAERLLRADRHASLAMVATTCGFADQAHFSRLFKRVFRVTPGDYRRRLGQARRRGKQTSETAGIRNRGPVE